jgi:hypothetical protein
MTNSSPDPDNRLLRRVDWRFLLPSASPRATVCLAGGDLFEAVTRISPLVASSFVNGPDRCDLIVASNPDAPTLAAARTRLGDDGACYAEFSGRSATSTVVRGAMLRAGFDDVRVYRRWPSDDHCQAWVPDEPAWVADAYFGQRAGLPDSAVTRALRRARRGLSAWRHHRGEPRSLCAIGLAAPADDARSPIVLQTGGSRVHNKVIAYLFDAAVRRPSCVLKRPRVEEAARGLSNEADVLEALHRLAVVPPGVPRVLFRRGCGAELVVGETPAVGAPLPIPRDEGRYRMIATSVTAWATRLADTSGRGPAPWRAIVDSAMHEFEAGYGDAIDPSWPGLICRRLGAVQALPGVCEHRDLAPWNVVLDPAHDIVAHDWESAVLDGVPGLDLIYFLSYLAAWRHGLTLDVYRDAWSASTWIGRVNRDCLGAYAAALRIDAATLDVLPLLTWIIHARSEWQRLRDDHGGVPSVAALRQGVFLPLIEHEVRRSFEVSG